ncbi:MAG TPA: hypothetical protein VF145_06490 [Chitinophagaceae bacterium]
MNRKGTYPAALAVLTVFLLNTVISTTCAVSSIVHEAHHRSGTADHHSESAQAHHHHGNRGQDTHEAGGHCCSISMVAFNQQEKLVTGNIQPTPPILVFLYTLAVPGYIDGPVQDIGNNGVAHFLRRRHLPTIPDLRIAMQSFQI